MIKTVGLRPHTRQFHLGREPHKPSNPPHAPNPANPSAKVELVKFILFPSKKATHFFCVAFSCFSFAFVAYLNGIT